MRRHLSEFARRRRSVVRCWWFTEHHVVRAASATRSGRAWWPWWCSLCGQAARCASPAAEKSTEKHWMLCYWVPHGLSIWLNGVCFFEFRISFAILSMNKPRSVHHTNHIPQSDVTCMEVTDWGIFVLVGFHVIETGHYTNSDALVESKEMIIYHSCGILLLF